MKLAGIDVSNNNGTVDWHALRLQGEGELAFGFAKATDGRTYDDRFFAANWHGMRERGLHRGAYHYAEPQAAGSSAAAIRSAAQGEAEHFLSVLDHVGGVHAGDMPPALDLETSHGLTPQQLLLWVETWVERVHHHVGRPPIIYTGGFWKGSLAGIAHDHWGCPLWLAQYGPRAQVPPPWEHWTIWQYTSSGAVHGHAGPLDLNWFHSTRAELEKLAGGKAGAHAGAHAHPHVPHVPHPHLPHPHLPAHHHDAPAPPTHAHDGAPAHHHDAPAPPPHHDAPAPAAAHFSPVPAPPPPTAPPPAPDRVLQYGVQGPDVRMWQVRMYERGYVGMRTDGVFDAACAEQTRWFQLYLRLPATQRVDERVWRAAWTAP